MTSATDLQQRLAAPKRKRRPRNCSRCGRFMYLRHGSYFCTRGCSNQEMR